jgi:hypothetical protein
VTKGKRPGVATDGVCADCGERFLSSAKWERHSDQTGHRRFVLIVAGIPAAVHYGHEEVA